jgi:sugar-specific transcriptional regulator TrmB
MLKELQDIGLSDKEARVYVAALRIGRATAADLAKEAKILRSTTYVQLESLMKMGLMSTYEEGKKTFFAPESPELLKRLLVKQKDVLQARERDLTQLLPDLLRQFEGAGERPVVRFFDGKEGIISLRDEALSTHEKVLHVISSNDHLANVFTIEERNEFSERRAARAGHWSA